MKMIGTPDEAFTQLPGYPFGLRQADAQPETRPASTAKRPRARTVGRALTFPRTGRWSRSSPGPGPGSTGMGHGIAPSPAAFITRQISSSASPTCFSAWAEKASPRTSRKVSSSSAT